MARSFSFDRVCAFSVVHDKTMSGDSDRALAKELVKFSGLVAGSNGRGGSGTCVQLEDGAIALLTAKHVVLECLRNTGRVGIAAYGVKFQEPALIRMDSSQYGDAAYLVFKDVPVTHKALPFAVWTKNRTDIRVGQHVLVCGFPGAFRKIEGRSVTPTVIWVGDQILAIEGNRVVSGIDETIKGVPSTFGGLSGAGLFSDDGRFIGVAIEEKRRVSRQRGELCSILPGEFPELYTPFSMPPEAPSGEYHAERRVVSMTLLKPDGSGVQAIVGVMAECLWSAINPDHECGRVGRLLSLEFNIPGIETHYPININSTFTWSGDTEEDRLKAIHEEFKFLLLRMRWLVKDDPSGEVSVQVNPLT